jgi:hypothetical protein
VEICPDIKQRKPAQAATGTGLLRKPSFGAGLAVPVLLLAQLLHWKVQADESSRCEVRMAV